MMDLRAHGRTEVSGALAFGPADMVEAAGQHEAGEGAHQPEAALAFPIGLRAGAVAGG